MKILVNHSALNNLGDMAMIEGVVRRLLHTAKGIKLYVQDNPSLPKQMWETNNITRVAMRLSEPINQVPYVHRIPFLRRYSFQLKKIGICGFHAMLDRGMNPSNIQIGSGSDKITLGTWCSEYDAMHVVGMGGLTDFFLPVVWQHCCLVHTFAMQGKPVIFTGQQIGPISSRLTKNLLQRALRKAEFVGVREPTDSLSFCQQALADNRFALMGDDSFGLRATEESTVKSFLSRFDLSPGKFLAVNVRVGNYAPEHGKHIQQIAQLITNLSKRYDIPIVVVPISLVKWDSDIISGYQLAEATSSDRIQVLDSQDLTAALVKGILGQAYAAVGVSYHFCTFALSAGVPAICIFDGDYYSQKARGLSCFWGDERLALPLNKLDLQQATKQVSQVIEDPQFRAELRKRAFLALQKWQEIFDQKVQETIKRVSCK